MIKSMRDSTLQTLGLGSVLEIFRNGRLPATAADLVDRVFGKAGARGSMVISGANGIVGAGKTMQFGSRLQPFGVRLVALDLPSAPDGIGRQYPGLERSFGRARATEIMSNIVRLSYDGAHLPAEMKQLEPRFVLEAIPEILAIKKAHYQMFRETFPDVVIRSATSGFPSSELGVGIAHPAFPHEINKVFEIIEESPTPSTQLLWALGLIPVPVTDHWSFVLDVLFCGVTLAGLRWHRSTSIPYWKADKYIRKLLGPNPFRAHDAIGAKGAIFLTWSCLHHLSKRYGPLFEPTPDLVEHKESGQGFYPMNHFRPVVNFTLDDAEDEAEFKSWVLGPLIQMTSLMLHEGRAHLSHINAIGELCAQFRQGVLAAIRTLGADASIEMVEGYHRLHPVAADESWHPEVFERLGDPAWQQLYVNAEHDGSVGVVSISRESYNGDVDSELNRTIDWLKAEGIDRVIVTGDFHLSTQMVGADTSAFFPALDESEAGLAICNTWSATARRLNDEFAVSVGFVGGKRCLGGFLELLLHCHYLVSVDGAELGMPEVTLPVVPGMEGCHWPFRKARSDDWPKLLGLLLSGEPVRAKEATGWLVDYAGPIEEVLQVAFKIATGGDHGVGQRPLREGALAGIPTDVAGLGGPESPLEDAARRAIVQSVQNGCGATLGDALPIQSRHAADFLRSSSCRAGRVGAEFKKTMAV